MPPPDFNPDRFEALTLGDRAIQDCLLDAFLRQAPQLRVDLAAAGEAASPSFGDLLHLLKGSCHFVAGERLAALAAEAEDALAAGRAGRACLPALLDAFDTLHGRVRGELAARRGATIEAA